ncbi:MAG: M18 family aminopeptidase [Acidimicrobiales bacterium]|jgi:aspartyl aminopeptidase
MRDVDLDFARALGADIDASPTPYHAVARVRAALDDAGFSPYDSANGPVGRWYHERGGGIVAWVVGPGHHETSGVRVIGAHTDSPNLRIKPQPDTGSAGIAQLGVEVYGGVLLNSWLDRDLGLAGRVAVESDGEVEMHEFRVDRPLLRIPQLAIHLDRGVNENGLVLNKQRHLAPMWGLGSAPEFRAFVAGEVGADPEAILAWDAMVFDLTPARLVGLDEEFFASARIDNQLSCFAAVAALLRVAEEPGDTIPMIALFDHEEVGSVSTTGAASPFLRHQLERIHAAFGADHEARLASAARSLIISADGAHATHPNYPDRHEPDHEVALNGGPVLKINANQRYATDAASAAALELACRRAEVPVQRFVTRTDLACGSTIGPATAGELGIDVVDVGVAQLAMHSAREVAGSADLEWFTAALEAALRA